MSTAGLDGSVSTAAPDAAVQLLPITTMGEVVQGDDLATAILSAARAQNLQVRDGDIVVVSSKILAKAAGLRIPARDKAAAVLRESVRVVSERLTATGITRIVESKAGPVLAAAGIDASNTGPEGGLLVLPADPDAAAAALLRDLLSALAAADDGVPTVQRLAVLVTDTAGRPWRVGQTDFALGAAGMSVLDDLRGRTDDDGRPLRVTARAVADEVAAAADLVKGKTGRVAVTVVRGLPHLVRPASAPLAEEAAEQPSMPATGTPADPPWTRAAQLIRAGPGDWFQFGHLEAVRSALGVLPGTAAAIEVGVPAAGDEPLLDKVERACALAVRNEGLGQAPDGHPRAHLLVGNRLELYAARTDVVQNGVRVSAPDHITVGLVTARLLVALAGEGVPAALAAAPPSAGRTGSPHCLVVFL